MHRRFNIYALRPYGMLLLFIGALGLTMKSWIAQTLHISSQHGKNAVDFSFGLALGLGLSLAIVTFSGKRSAPDEADD